MAPVNATPLSQRTLSPFDDTPTRAPSSGHSSLNPLTSLKPQRTRSLSSFATALRQNNSHSLLADPIEADNTELHRRRVEASFQRQLDSLANANRHLDSSSATSSDHDHDHGHDRDHKPRRRFNDESASSSSSSSRSHGTRSSDAQSLGSLRIGLTGSAPVPETSSSRTARGVTIEDVDDGADSDSDGHLTYVTERASVLDSPARPLATAPAPKQQQQQQAPARAAAAAPSGGLFGSPRPSVLSHMHAATSSPRRSTGLPPRDENLPPSPAARPVPSFGSTDRAAYPSVAPPRTVAPPASYSARSPFSPAAGPRIGAGVAAAAGSAYKPKHYSPLNPALNSPLNASPAASTVRGAGSRVHSPTSLVLDDDADDESDQDEDEARRMADRTTRTALPDRTGLTDMLRSPKARRGEPAVASTSARRASPAGSGSGSGRSAEANLVSTALAGLTSKLASLERDNAQSAARVAELEARLAAQQQERPAVAREQQRERDGATQEREEQARRLRREVETMLGEERDRRAELERVVQSLRAQNAHLDATLSAQHAALASLRTAAAPAPAPAPAAAAKGEYALRTEVQDLKHALAALGYEVDGVRTVVEELLRDKEARDAGRRWDAEEAERRAALDELSVEGGGGGGRGQDEGSRSSFVAPSEVERLVREQEEEVRRRRRASTGAQRPAKHVPHRAAPAAVNAKYDSTYVPSLSDSAGSRSSASLVSATSATSYTTSASADAFDAAAPVDDEPDFARAQRIFDDVQAVSSPPRARRTQPARAVKAKATAKPDRVVLVDEPSAHLCTNCHGRKSALRAAGTRRHDDVDGGADADEEDLAFATGEAEARRARAAKKERRRVKEQAAAAAAEAEEKMRAAAEKEERRRSRARDEHRRTLEGVLDRLEGDFAVQKKLYLELTAEYQSMSSRADTRKRRVLASHLKGSIDVLEDKAREVKRYADALEDLYETMHEQTCPRRRKAHASI
ncbi:hypothetical protein JCM3775_006640 [Rhodotorula graminis]